MQSGGKEWGVRNVGSGVRSAEWGQGVGSKK